MSIDDEVMLMKMARDIFTDEELDEILTLEEELDIDIDLDDIFDDEGDEIDE
jgi:hypothetical protein